MEYRVKYRDIPWPVAIGVLPGKIIGALFIKPWKRFTRNNGYYAKVWVSRIGAMLLVVLLATILFIAVDQLTNGYTTASLDQAWDWWLSLIQSANEAAPAPTPTPTEIGLR